MRPYSRLVSSLSVLLCLVWLGLPRVGLAAQDAPLAELPRLALSGPLADFEDVPDTLESAPSKRFHPPRALRVLTEVGTGLITSAAGGIVLGLTSYGFCEATGVGDGKMGCLGPLVLGTAVGLVEGYGLGVWWGGELMGGDGFLALSLLGAGAGSLGSFALLQSGRHPELAGYSFIVLPVLLSHLGYELFQRAAPEGQTASGPRLLPLVSFSSQGAQLGLSGRF